MCRALLCQGADGRDIGVQDGEAASDRWVVSDLGFGIEDGVEVENEGFLEAVVGLCSKVKGVNGTDVD